MQSQSDCDEAKAICEKYGLPYWKSGFGFLNGIYMYFSFVSNIDFWVFNKDSTKNKTEVSLTRFKELCEEWKQLNK